MVSTISIQTGQSEVNLKPLDVEFNQLWHQLGSVNSQPQGAIAQTLDVFESYLKYTWETYQNLASQLDLALPKSVRQEIRTLLYIRQLCRTGLRQGFIIADPNQDGIPELFWLNDGQLWVLSPVGGQLRYWVDLHTGQVLTSRITCPPMNINTIEAQSGGALHERLQAHQNPENLLPANARYPYLFREQNLTFQYQSPALHLTKQLQYQPENQQFTVTYTFYNPTATPLTFECHIDNIWTLDAWRLAQTTPADFNWKIAHPDTYTVQGTHTPLCLTTQAKGVKKWFCQSSQQGCRITPMAEVSLLPSQKQILVLQIKANL